MTKPAPYDPSLRRDTPLARLLAARIRSSGPITVADYVETCLTHPGHGYYTTRKPLGREGDFITAPEISQVFGELLGLWSAIVWQQMGMPRKFVLAEIGPGRGTMMRDIVRATRIVPGFLDGAAIHFVDVVDNSELLADLAERAPLTPVYQHRAVNELPRDLPMILLANEYLDALPLLQFEISDSDCYVRGVGLDDAGRLQFVRHSPAAYFDREGFLRANSQLQEGDIFEAQDLSVLHVLPHARTAPWAALLIDYGHFDPARPSDHIVAGDTLQAVRAHAYEHPLTSPGEADLTAEVDFNDVALNIATASAIDGALPLSVDGPITQAEFLGRLGIVERTRALMAANPGKATEIESATARLLAAPGMGSRFKVIGIRSSSLPFLPALEPAPN